MLRGAARAAAGIALLGASSALAQANRATGSVDVIAALESAPGAVVAEVVETRRLDRQAWSATLAVETPLRGGLARGAQVSIAWEELAPSRRARFARGERILVALEPLSGASIWLGRIPDPKARTATLSPALRGDAFLRRPSIRAVRVLEHYLALSPEGRADTPGIGYLAELAARAELPLARSAVERLGERPELDGRLDPGGAQLLVDALLRPDSTAQLQDAVVELVGSRQLESLREPLQRATQQDTLAPAAVYAALARLDGELSAGTTERLLQTEASYRAVAARHAGGPNSGDLLGRLIRTDPDAAVRSAAIERLLELEGRAALPRVATGLYDRELDVRMTAAQGLGSLGAAAVPELERTADRGDREAAQAAVAGLMLTESREGREALGRIADAHPDEAIRKLARAALGQPIGHTD